MNTAACTTVAARNITNRGSAAVTMNCWPMTPAREPDDRLRQAADADTPLDSASWMSPATLPASIPLTGPLVSAT